MRRIAALLLAAALTGAAGPAFAGLGLNGTSDVAAMAADPVSP